MINHPYNAQVRKLVAFASAALIAFTLAGCDNGEPESPGDPGLQTDAVTVSAGDALKVDGFTVMRSDSSEKTVTDAAVKLKNSINSTIDGAAVSLGTDWVNRGDPVPTDTPEIVVGDSNRMTQSGLRSGDFEIIRSGNRIYILGGSGEAVSKGVDYFIDSYLSNAGLTIPDNTDLRFSGEYKVESIVFGSTEIEELKIYTGKNVEEKSEIYRSRFVPLLEEATGLTAEIVDDPGDANIIYADSDQIKNGDWGYVVENGRLTAVGRSDAEKMKLFRCLSGMLEPADRTLSLKEGVYSEHQMSKEEFLQMKQLVIYPEFPEAINRDYTYEVSVTQGSRTEKLPVYNHTLASTVSRGYDGADDVRRFSMFAFSGEEVRVDIKVKTDFTSYSVMPSAKNFRHEFKDGVISVYLDEPDYFLIRLDDSDNSIISVFADEPEYTDEFDESEPNFIKIEGWVEPEGGILELKEKNTTLYITPGSVLNARVDIRGEGSKVIGHGAIVDPFENIYEYDIRVGGTEGSGKHLLNISGNNMTLDGPILLDARCFNITVGGNNHNVRNMKVMSTMMTTDGISVYWGKDTVVEHCFVYCGDNTMVFSAENTIYRDITGGTTCASLFPQGNPKNVTLEDIHIFRSDDGLINHIYNGSKGQLTSDVIVKNLDSVDCTYMPWFFLGRNMGELVKNFNISNISLGDPVAQKLKFDFRFGNGSNYVKSDNYDLVLKNFAKNGEIVTSLDGLSINIEGDPKHPGNKYAYSTDNDFKPIVRDSTTVDYKAPDKVFIGSWQVFFREPMIDDGGLLLPAEQLMTELYTDKCAAVVEKNGVKYVRAADLVSSGMAASVEEKDGALYIVPITPKGNLFAPDSGEISNFSESTCYELDLVTSKEGDDTIYTVYNTKMTLNSGIARVINEEVRKLGAGSYVFSFMANASESGNLSVGVFFKNANAVVSTISVADGEMKEYSFKFVITEEMLGEAKINLVVRGSGKALESFSMKDFKLTKAE